MKYLYHAIWSLHYGTDPAQLRERLTGQSFGLTEGQARAIVARAQQAMKSGSLYVGEGEHFRPGIFSAAPDPSMPANTFRIGTTVHYTPAGSTQEVHRTFYIDTKWDPSRREIRTTVRNQVDEWLRQYHAGAGRDKWSYEIVYTVRGTIR